MIDFRRHPGLVAAVSVVLLAVYGVASFGMVPSARVVVAWFGRVSGERYPCEGCGCGCASANECWTNCCCHSEHERLVWAIRNGVMPPAVARFTDEQWIAAANAVKSGSAHCVLCVERIKDQLGRGIATKGESGEAASEVSESCCAAPAAAWQGLSMSALSCKGLSQLLALTLPPAPAPSVVVMVIPEPVHVEPVWREQAVPGSRTLDVPEPPPRWTLCAS